MRQRYAAEQALAVRGRTVPGEGGAGYAFEQGDPLKVVFGCPGVRAAVAAAGGGAAPGPLRVVPHGPRLRHLTDGGGRGRYLMAPATSPPASRRCTTTKKIITGTVTSVELAMTGPQAVEFSPKNW